MQKYLNIVRRHLYNTMQTPNIESDITELLNEFTDPAMKAVGLTLLANKPTSDHVLIEYRRTLLDLFAQIDRGTIFISGEYDNTDASYKFGNSPIEKNLLAVYNRRYDDSITDLLINIGLSVTIYGSISSSPVNKFNPVIRTILWIIQCECACANADEFNDAVKLLPAAIPFTHVGQPTSKATDQVSQLIAAIADEKLRGAIGKLYDSQPWSIHAIRSFKMLIDAIAADKPADKPATSPADKPAVTYRLPFDRVLGVTRFAPNDTLASVNYLGYSNDELMSMDTNISTPLVYALLDDALKTGKTGQFIRTSTKYPDDAYSWLAVNYLSPKLRDMTMHIAMQEAIDNIRLRRH